jgi:circadian clock protein KaiC
MLSIAQLPKIHTGVAGFDELTMGGLPAGRSTLICGGPGCGKTLFATTFLVNGAVLYDEPGVLVSFEERPGDLVVNAASLGCDLSALIAGKKIVIDHVRIERNEIAENGEFDLEGLFLRIDCAVRSIGAKRVVLDTVETLFAGFTDAALIRSELRRLFGWMKDRGLTSVITAETGGAGQLTRHGLEEYVADCVILLDNRVHDQVTTRRVRVIKYRGSSHGADEYPFLIDGEGITVMPELSPGVTWPAVTDIFPTGIAGLDGMFQKNGLYRGSSILLSGGPGSGKTTIGTHFIDAACARGERCLFFGFEEGANEYTRNASSVGINLDRWIKADLLRLDVVRPNFYGLEGHLARMSRECAAFDPAMVVIDPISSFFGSDPNVQGALLRILNLLKSKGTTALFTSLQGFEASHDHGLCSLMDTWIKLVDVESDGERNHVLYIMKARGLSHSNQMREYRTTNAGVRLMTAYSGPNGIVTGAASLTQKAREQATATDRQDEVEWRRRVTLRKRETLISQIGSLAAELQMLEDKATKVQEQDITCEVDFAGSSRNLRVHPTTAQ